MTNSLIVEKKANPALTDTLKNQIASKLLDVLNDGTGLMIKLLRTWRRKRRQEKADRRQLRRQQLRDSNEIGDSLEDVEDEDDDDDDDDEEIPKDTRKELGTGGEEVWGKFVMSCANLEEVNACWKVWGAFGGAVQHLMQLFKTKATRTSCGYTNVNEM